MAVFTAIAFATFLFENDYFVAFHEGFDYLAGYFGAFYSRCAYSYIAVSVYEEHFVKADSLALLNLVAEMVYIQILAFFGFELLSFDFYNSVHANLLIYRLDR